MMALIWGVNFSVAKYGTTTFSPLAFNGLRVMLAFAVLAGIATLGRSVRPAAADIRRLMLLGVLGHGVYQVCFIEGLARTPAGTAALVFAASPAFIAIFGRVMGTERVSGRGWAGIALQLAGMVAVVLGSAARAGTTGDTSLLGLALVLGGCICWALFTVLLKPYTERVDGMQISAWTMGGGVVMLGALSIPALAATPWHAVGAPAWGAVLYSGLGALVVAYLFWYNGVKTIGPTRTAMFSNLQPIIALVVAYFLLREVPTAAQLAGTTAIMTGLLLSRS
jgi:drug/metabolite transporter (DMT)-like permease